MKKILLFLSALTMMVGGQIPVAASAIASEAVGTELDLEQTMEFSSEESVDESTDETNESNDTTNVSEEETAEETTEERADVEVGTFAIDSVITDGAHTFYMNPNRTIKYASVTENGRVVNTLQYYPNTRMEDVKDNKDNRLNYRAYIRPNGTVDHVRGYRENGDWFEVLEYNPNTRLNQNDPYWFQRTKTFVLVPGRTDGLIGHATTYTAPKVPQVAAQSMFYAGAKYGQDHMKQLRYEAHLTPDWTVKYVSIGENGRIVRQNQYHPGTKYNHVVDNIDNRVHYSAYLNTNGTVNHVRSYNMQGHWYEALEYPQNTRLNQDNPYWHQRTITHFMLPNSTDGLISRTTEYTVPKVPTPKTHVQYYEGAYYGQGHERKVKYRAHVNPNDTLGYVQGYRENGDWFEVLEFAPNTKINHNKPYWDQRTKTFGLVPHPRDGFIDNVTTYTGPNATTVKSYSKYPSGTKYGGHAAKLAYEAHMNQNGTVKYVTKFEDGTKSYQQYYAGTRYTDIANNVDNKRSYTAYVRANDTIAHVRGYRENGAWFEALEFPEDKKIDHDKPYWDARKFTFYLVPRKTEEQIEGQIDYAVEWDWWPNPNSTKVVQKFLYQNNTFYDQGHGQRIKQIIQVSPRTPKPEPKPAPKPQPKPEGPKWVMPVKHGYVSCILEDCDDGPYTYNEGRHNGTDIAYRNGGESVHSIAAGGTVKLAQWINGLGNTIGIHYYVDNIDFFVVYAHLESMNVNVGQRVDMDQTIGIVGDTGGDWGRHLHIEVRPYTKDFIGNAKSRRTGSVGLNWFKEFPIHVRQTF